MPDSNSPKEYEYEALLKAEEEQPHPSRRTRHHNPATDAVTSNAATQADSTAQDDEVQEVIRLKPSAAEHAAESPPVAPAPAKVEAQAPLENVAPPIHSRRLTRREFGLEASLLLLAGSLAFWQRDKLGRLGSKIADISAYAVGDSKYESSLYFNSPPLLGNAKTISFNGRNFRPHTGKNSGSQSILLGAPVRDDFNGPSYDYYYENAGSGYSELLVVHGSMETIFWEGPLDNLVFQEGALTGQKASFNVTLADLTKQRFHTELLFSDKDGQRKQIVFLNHGPEGPFKQMEIVDGRGDTVMKYDGALFPADHVMANETPMVKALNEKIFKPFADNRQLQDRIAATGELDWREKERLYDFREQKSHDSNRLGYVEKLAREVRSGQKDGR